MTEWGYARDADLQGTSPNNQLISAVRSFITANPSLMAGSSYWQDMGNWWQKNSPDAGGNSNLLSAPLIPFDYTDGTCPVGAYCPFVQTCTFSTPSCPDWSATGQAWAYKQNQPFWNQFAQ